MLLFMAKCLSNQRKNIFDLEFKSYNFHKANIEEEEKDRLAAGNITSAEANGEEKPQKLGRKTEVKELPKQANGTFVAASVAPAPFPSPRACRANKTNTTEGKDQTVRNH